MAIATCSQPLGQAVYGVVFEQARGQEWAIFAAAGIASIIVSLYLRKDGLRKKCWTGEQRSCPVHINKEKSRFLYVLCKIQ